MLRRNWFHVLVALAEGELHGAAIAEDVLGRTGGELRLWPATLYRALDELVAGGLATEVPDAERPAGESQRKRYYRMTGEGRRVLADEAGRLEALAREARARLGEIA